MFRLYQDEDAYWHLTIDILQHAPIPISSGRSPTELIKLCIYLAHLFNLLATDLFAIDFMIDQFNAYKEAMSNVVED